VIYITKEDCSSTRCPPQLPQAAAAAAGSYSGGRGKQLEPFRRVEPERLVA